MTGRPIVIFDFDGTLADTRPAILNCMAATFSYFDRPAPQPDAIDATIGKPLAESFMILCPGLDAREAEAWVPVYREFSVKRTPELSRLFEGVGDVLASLKHAGTRMGVLSNKGEAVLRDNISGMGLEGLFDLAAGAVPGRPAKPSPRLFQDVVVPAFPGLVPEDFVIVGDAEPDLELALAIGSSSCWAAWGYGDPVRCQALNPDHTANSLDELASILLP